MTDDSEQRATAFALLVADVFEAAGRLRRRGERIARTAGQTQARWQVMSVVSEAGASVPRIAERLGITRQSAQRTADELAATGLARWRENARHRRSPLLALTADGRHALAALSRAARLDHVELVRAFGAKLLPARSGLRRLLELLREPGTASPRGR